MTQTQLHIIVVVTFPLSSVSLQVLSKQVEQGRYPMAVSLDSFPFAIDTTAGCMYVQAIVYVLFYYLFIDDIDVLYRKTPAVDLHETIVILCSWCDLLVGIFKFQKEAIIKIPFYIKYEF